MMSKEVHVQLMRELFSRNKEEINEIFNSGVFNEITEAYMTVSLIELGLNAEIINKAKAVLRKKMDEMTAGEVQKEAQKWTK